MMLICWGRAGLVALVLSLSAGLFEASAQDAGDGACDPEIRQGLVESATVGVQEDLAVIRDPDQGIRNPDSILDLSCLEELFDFGGFDVFYTPQDSWLDVLGLLQRRICAVANDAYDKYVGRRLDPSVMLGDLDRRARRGGGEASTALPDAGAARPGAGCEPRELSKHSGRGVERCAGWG